MAHFTFLFCLVFVLEAVVATMRVSLVNDGPAVCGSNLTFTASVTGYDGSEKLEFVYWDNAQPQHYSEFYIQSNVSTWTVAYPRDLYESGEYTARVDLKRSYVGIYIVVDSATTTFKLTESLNGNLVLSQNNTERPNSFVAVNKTVNHYIRLPDKELQFLKSNASSVITYWFMDCMFIDMTTDFTLNYTYSDAMNSHYVDALVVANHKPLPPIPAITTTTPKPNMTTTIAPPTTTIVPPPTTIVPPTTVVPPITTVVPPTTVAPNTTNGNESLAVHKLVKRAASNKTFKKKLNPLKDFICKNSIVPIGEGYTYGHYQETINVREPIGSPVNITGLNWLQHEDLMNLLVKYSGSPPFDYCAIYKIGQYNITGNETCVVNPITTVSNNFSLVHYFSDTDQHTVVVIIENDIGKVVSRATINIYKVSVHAQLSVIVVPVVFCLLAVILVVFGVAYLHRSRYTVEVADFDFGQQSHLDYKTFSERLRDSFRNAFKFGHHEDTDPLTANTRYDSMT